MSRGRLPGFDDRDGDEVQPFGWPARYLAEDRDRRLVLAWARCQATGASFRDLCRELDWSRLNPDRRRRAILLTIAAGLNRDGPARDAA